MKLEVKVFGSSVDVSFHYLAHQEQSSQTGAPGNYKMSMLHATKGFIKFNRLFSWSYSIATYIHSSSHHCYLAHTFPFILISGSIPWWQRMERDTLIIIIATIVAILICVLIICCIIIFLCRRKRASNKCKLFYYILNINHLNMCGV